MVDIDEQLAALRRRIAAVNRQWERPGRPEPATLPARVARSFIEEWAEGEVRTTPLGSHFEMERLYEAHRRHGTADIGALRELPSDLLGALSEGEIGSAPPTRWAFLDTETTGLAGGAGTYAFLIGVGRITADGFRVRQFFMREYAEERSVLHALSEHLGQFDVLVTYNGRSYDQPLLETRYQLAGQKPPFARLPHLDLLYGSRRLWKQRYETCRLTLLERQVLGFERTGDLPGEMIPYVYFEYLRSREAQRLIPVFHHNAVDILTLGCLTGLVPFAFRAVDASSLDRLGLRRGEEILGVARWLASAGATERALVLFHEALQRALPDAIAFRALWETAQLEKRSKRPQAALPLWLELTSCANEYRHCALEELAKYHEHVERDETRALELTRQALSLRESESLQRRRARLEQRQSRKRRAAQPSLSPRRLWRGASGNPTSD